MARRRFVFLALVVGTCCALTAWMASLLGRDGFDLLDVVMLAFYAGTLPWVVIGLWNAMIGIALIHLDREWLRTVVPLSGLDEARSGPSVIESRPPSMASRTAIVMPVFNEDPDRVVRHLAAVEASLASGGDTTGYAFFLLSDSNDPEIVAEETRRFDAWRAASARPDRLHYRRRTDNARQKVGNLEEFCERWGDAFDYMLVLDADSLMSGGAIRRLVRMMDANPTLGILQTLIVGLPAKSGFARVFQFGMRHGMRAYTTGSAWWQGDSGPYWGHNAILRLLPFRRHCRLPRLAGSPPLGGEILSHDQVEASMMRAAGYEVRVLPIEDGSYEENPPSLLDFVKRDLRWCQGNMQYLSLLGWSVWRPLGRLQLALAILMYVSAPLWLGFIALGMVRVIAGGVDPANGLAFGQGVVDGVAWSEGVALFATMMTITFAPKIAGVLDILLSSAKRMRYGGGRRVAAGATLELLFGMLLAPVVAVAQTSFIAGLAFGQRITWGAQMRDVRVVTWRQAITVLWPQALLGLVAATALALQAPAFLPWAALLLLAWLLAVPFAVLTASPAVGAWLERYRVCAVPEEFHRPAEIETLRSRGRSLAPVGRSAGPGGPMAPSVGQGIGPSVVVPARPQS